jgi:hypothetical protein
MTMTPVRVRRTRTKNGGVPLGAVYVGRPTKWGNPWPATHGRQEVADDFQTWLTQPSLMLYEARRETILSSLHELTGHDLACWCRLDEPCHADTLLDLANTDPGDTVACGRCGEPGQVECETCRATCPKCDGPRLPGQWMCSPCHGGLAGL